VDLGTLQLKKTLPFRALFYFRVGWGTYFAYIMAAINVLTVTYFLAIENYPSLQVIFPTFVHYISTAVGIGVPLLVLIGYAHYKRSVAFRAEAEIEIEANPYWYKAPPGWNKEVEQKQKSRLKQIHIGIKLHLVGIKKLFFHYILI